MPAVDIPQDTFTTTQAAEMFGKEESHIRRLCLIYDLGTVLYGRIRLLKKRDIRKLERHFEERGRNREKKS